MGLGRGFVCQSLRPCEFTAIACVLMSLGESPFAAWKVLTKVHDVSCLAAFTQHQQSGDGIFQLDLQCARYALACGGDQDPALKATAQRGASGLGDRLETANAIRNQPSSVES